VLAFAAWRSAQLTLLLQMPPISGVSVALQSAQAAKVM
jgi:hypothetical protein